MDREKKKKELTALIKEIKKEPDSKVSKRLIHKASKILIGLGLPYVKVNKDLTIKSDGTINKTIADPIISPQLYKNLVNAIEGSGLSTYANNKEIKINSVTLNYKNNEYVYRKNDNARNIILNSQDIPQDIKDKYKKIVNYNNSVDEYDTVCMHSRSLVEMVLSDLGAKKQAKNIPSKIESVKHKLTQGNIEHIKFVSKLGKWEVHRSEFPNQFQRANKEDSENITRCIEWLLTNIYGGKGKIKNIANNIIHNRFFDISKLMDENRSSQELYEYAQEVSDNIKSLGKDNNIWGFYYKENKYFIQFIIEEAVDENGVKCKYLYRKISRRDFKFSGNNPTITNKDFELDDKFKKICEVK